MVGGRGRLPHTKATAPSMPPGEILVQMSDTQRHLNSDLEVVVSIRLQGLKGSLEESGERSKERAQPTRCLSQGG